MAGRILGAFVALWGLCIIIFKFAGDGDHLLGEPISPADLVILMFGWVLLGVGVYIYAKGFRR